MQMSTLWGTFFSPSLSTEHYHSGIKQLTIFSKITVVGLVISQVGVFPVET
jgi:hypothetical protein